MPRLSPEARFGAALRAGLSPPQPPADLSKEAADAWRTIVSAFPADRFDPGNYGLLARYCRTLVYAAKVHDELEKHEIGTDQHGKLHRQLMSANNSCGSLATLLRLTVQARVDRRSGKIEERHIRARPWDDNPLLGGQAVRPEQ